MKKIAHVALTLTLLAPLGAAAQVLQSTGGVFNCNAGQYGGSPGTTAALGGVYVPVSDAGVTLNTGVLVYKECILRAIVDSNRKLMTSAQVQQGTVSFMTGRTTVDGNQNQVQAPLFPVNLGQDRKNEAYRVLAADIKNGAFNGLDPTFRDQVQRAAVRQYVLSSNNRYGDLTCPYNLGTLPQTSIWNRLAAYQNPACYALGAYYKTSDHIYSDVGSNDSEMLMRLGWNNGIYDVAAPDEYGNMIVKTPGIFVSGAQQQLLTSGFRQQESATDINQMVSALFSGLSLQIMQSGGLAGLTQSSGGPSYLQQVVNAAAQEVGNSSANAGLAVVQGMRTTEKAYRDIMAAILNILTAPATTFKNAEAQCFASIISKICAGPPDTNRNCTSIPVGACTTDPATGVQTCPTGVALKVATSTAFSDFANARVPGIGNVSVLQQNIKTSETTLAFFDKLVATLTSGGSSEQQQALNQLSAIIRSNQVHTGTDVQTAQGDQGTLGPQVQQYVTATQNAWSGNDSNGNPGSISWNGVTPPGSSTDTSGWCNFNDSTTQQRWINKWKK